MVDDYHLDEGAFQYVENELVSSEAGLRVALTPLYSIRVLCLLLLAIDEQCKSMVFSFYFFFLLQILKLGVSNGRAVLQRDV